MNMKKMMMALGAAILGGTGFAPSAYGAMERPVPPSVFVQDVKFRQRYPWNGLVDIDANIYCSDANTNLAVYVAAWDNVKDRPLTVKTVWVDGDATKNPDFVVKSGTRRIVWDARADNPNEISSNVSVSVQAYVRDMRYLVIDLSGGVDAETYPYSFMPDMPEGGWTDEYKTTNLVMRLIPAGTFLEGSPDDEIGRYNNEIQRKVTLTQPFYMAIFETTQRQYELVTGTNPSYAKNPKGAVGDISYISIRGDASVYVWPTIRTVSPTSFLGKLQERTAITSIDLPTEAKWEYTCRAETTTAFNNGKNLTSTNSAYDAAMSGIGLWNYRPYASSSGANYSFNVGRFSPNAWGLYDMHGNLAEWCLDNSYRTPQAAINPEDVYSSGSRQVKGGFWGDEARYCRSANRTSLSTSAVNYRRYILGGNSSYSDGYTLGFRICCDANLLK